jgi:hypothetical protein
MIGVVSEVKNLINPTCYGVDLVTSSEIYSFKIETGLQVDVESLFQKGALASRCAAIREPTLKSEPASMSTFINNNTPRPHNHRPVQQEPIAGNVQAN